MNRAFQRCGPLHSVIATRSIRAPFATGFDQRSPFLRALPREAQGSIPEGMLSFHVSGGECRGPLRVTRGEGLAHLLAILGRLPASTPVGRQPEDVVVTSAFDAASGGVKWARLFPRSPVLESRWYFDEASGLAIDSFTFVGIKDFAAFGFDLLPEKAPHTDKSGYVGFRHITRAVWIMGVPVPLSLALIADGVSMPHEDGGGWTVDVLVEHKFLGTVVSYTGDVRLIA